METYNVSNLEDMTREYIINQFKNNFPNTDTTENSPTRDLFINPLVSILQPFLKEISNMEFMSNLNNAEHMEESDLDEIGSGNYFIERNIGSKAKGEVVFSFSSSIGNIGVVIPKGITVSNSDKTLKFLTTEENIYSSEELFSYYNSSSYNYEIPVSIEAVEVGEEYNVGEGIITLCTDSFNVNLKQVTNNVSFYNGTNKESNADYANRIKQFYISRHLGTSPGYKQYVLENFPEVNDVLVVGAGNDKMIRDIGTFQKADNTTYTDHIGGKVDLYLRGTTTDTDTVTLTAKTGLFYLSKKNIVSTSIVTKNGTTTLNKTITPSGDGYLVLVPATFNSTTQWADGDTITVTYNYKQNATDTNTIEDILTFTVDSVLEKVQCPFINIISIKNTVTNTELDLTNNEIVIPVKTYPNTMGNIVSGTLSDDLLEVLENSTKEDVSLKISSSVSTIINGTPLQVKYSYNKTLNGLDTLYNKHDNRIIVTDILAKEATSTYINIGFNVKLKTGYSLDSAKISMIRNCIINYLSKIKFGEIIKESDIVAELYTDKSISSFLQYVELPFVTFNRSDTTSGASADRTGTTITLNEFEYPVLYYTNIATSSN